jgi:hypothetical protein|tara:strand:- start:335 stop:580 length:246 start_codon:yes stop_codon:yes gene_type:complete
MKKIRITESELIDLVKRIVNEEGGPMVPIDPHAGESSSEFDGMTREEARKTINWAAKHYNQTEKARKKAFYAKYGTLKGEE